MLKLYLFLPIFACVCCKIVSFPQKWSPSTYLAPSTHTKCNLLDQKVMKEFFFSVFFQKKFHFWSFLFISYQKAQIGKYQSKIYMWKYISMYVHVYIHYISLSLSHYIYIYMYVYTNISIYIYIYKFTDKNLYATQAQDCPVSWSCRKHQLLLCRGVRPPLPQRVSWIWH